MIDSNMMFFSWMRGSAPWITAWIRIESLLCVLRQRLMYVVYYLVCMFPSCCTTL